LIGTGLGVGLGYLLTISHLHIPFIFLPFSLTSLFCIYKSNRWAIINSLSKERLTLLLSLEIQGKQELLNLDQVSKNEHLLPSFKQNIIINGTINQELASIINQQNNIKDKNQDYLLFLFNDQVYIYYLENCNNKQVIKGYLHALIMYKLKNVTKSNQFINDNFERIWDSLLKSEWKDIINLNYIELNTHRIQFKD
jgi:hypothetical protein